MARADNIEMIFGWAFDCASNRQSALSLILSSVNHTHHLDKHPIPLDALHPDSLPFRSDQSTTNAPNLRFTGPRSTLRTAHYVKSAHDSVRVRLIHFAPKLVRRRLRRCRCLLIRRNCCRRGMGCWTDCKSSNGGEILKPNAAADCATWAAVLCEREMVGHAVSSEPGARRASERARTQLTRSYKCPHSLGVKLRGS